MNIKTLLYINVAIFFLSIVQFLSYWISKNWLLTVMALATAVISYFAALACTFIVAGAKLHGAMIVKMIEGIDNTKETNN